ncbi:purine and uridine phosphorylase [Colletotrichum zoysiae]|uniref:Purine and uridine phosphorylase n=1 Tax=Colletotrichum zoysiae TaxID=1216348 RepID=A0AAD9HU02_9PEZI|nr:purine and uridine phosphorylase [Colletotrichum zoysiae]
MGTNKRANSDVQDPDGQDDISTKRTRLDGSDLSQAHSHVVKEALAELTRDAYTVGWICALPVEQAAAVAMLDIEHKCPPVHKDDTNNYALGRIGMHNIAIACMSSYGSVNAAFVASHMIRTFPSIRIGLMVGIGGGVPARNDVRLGDIVVSHPTATSTGVEQYDSGKTEKGGLFKQTGKLNKPPQELLTAVAVLKAHHESRLSQIPAILAGLEKQKPRIVYPGVEHDRLFEADYEHQGSSCTDCDPSRLVKREARPDNNPRIHYGAIASANQVMKHGKTRDCIADELNVLCFEMEAAGLMDNFPCLVIRGICDYADSHKAKEWQPYAAAVAAAYAKELLLITHTHEVQNAVVTPSLNARSEWRCLPSRADT